ncbi:hypothetical protein V8G54_004909, partial [Vigna mungo]
SIIFLLLLPPIPIVPRECNNLHLFPRRCGTVQNNHKLSFHLYNFELQRRRPEKRKRGRWMVLEWRFNQNPTLLLITVVCPRCGLEVHDGQEDAWLNDRRKNRTSMHE